MQLTQQGWLNIVTLLVFRIQGEKPEKVLHAPGLTLNAEKWSSSIEELKIYVDV